MTLSIDRAAELLLGGGVIAYPTEGVFGLGCMPDDDEAILRILRIKHRDPAKGLILIAAERVQLDGWVAAGTKVPKPDSNTPTTWLVPAGPSTGPLVRGAHSTVAVRITTHPVAVALCNAVGSPLVSTSANISGRPVARTRFVLRRDFDRLVDYVVPGDCGPFASASEIRDLETSKTIRPHSI